MGLAAAIENGVAVVKVPGSRLDAGCAETFKSDLKGIIDQGHSSLVLDFGDVQFMDSSGLGAMVGCLKYMGAGGAIEIVNASPTIVKILKLTRMNKVFSIRGET